MDDKNPIMKDFEKNYIELTAQRIADIASEKIIKIFKDKTRDQSVLYEIHEKRLRRLEETVFNGLLDKIKGFAKEIEQVKKVFSKEVEQVKNLWWKVLIGVGGLIVVDFLMKHFRLY